MLECIRNINPTQDGAHVAIFFFASDNVLAHNFSSPQDLATIEAVLENFTCNYTSNSVWCDGKGSGGTATYYALAQVNNVTFNEMNGMRPDDIPKNVVVVTDGDCDCGRSSSNETLTWALERFEERGIRVIAVGIGNITTQPFLNRLATSPLDVFYANDTEELDETFIERVSYCSGTNNLKIDSIKSFCS